MQVQINGVVVFDMSPSMFLMRQALLGYEEYVLIEGTKVEFVLQNGARESEVIDFSEEG